MTLAIRIGGQVMSIGDLMPDEVSHIAKRFGTEWVSVYERPMQSSEMAMALVVLVSQKLGVPMPDVTTARSLYELFVLDVPALTVEVADPKEDDSTTT